MSFVQRGSTYFLRFIIVLLGVMVLAFCVFALPSMWQGGSAEFPLASQAIFLIMVGLYAAAVPFFVALWHGMKLLGAIDANKAFSTDAVSALRNIKGCATIISVLFVSLVPLLYPVAEADDAPGLLLIGMVIACVPIAIAVFAAVLQRLLQNAMDLKSENELTV
jgi:hypothetical protein